MAANLPRCMDVLKTCYEHSDPAICHAAATVCWDGVISYYDSESFAGGRNRFDSKLTTFTQISHLTAFDLKASTDWSTLHLVTAPCDIDDFCYASTGLIQSYLDLPSTFAALRVPAAIKNFTISSDAVAFAFDSTNDLEISLRPEIEYLLANQIDILIYQGNLDLACNTAGAKRWTSNVAWKGQAEFVGKELRPWKSVVGGKERKAGMFKEVNIKMVEGDEKRTRFALVTIDGSGHMVPQDQPEVALDMLGRWLAGRSFE